VIFRKTPTFAVLQTALRSDFSSLPLFKGLHYYECGKFTFPARGRASRQIGGFFRKVRFSETQVNYLGSRKMICADKSFFREFEGVADCGQISVGVFHDFKAQAESRFYTLSEKMIRFLAHIVALSGYEFGQKGDVFFTYFFRGGGISPFVPRSQSFQFGRIELFLRNNIVFTNFVE